THDRDSDWAILGRRFIDLLFLFRPLILQAKPSQNLGNELTNPLAMLGGNCDRLAKAQLKGLIEAVQSLAALAFVGDQNRRTPSGTHEPREGCISGRHSLASIDHEQDEVGRLQSGFRLPRHAGGNSPRRRLLEPGGIEYADLM